MEASILSALERAERDAQDRRLEAEAEADRLIRDARELAREIEAGGETRARAAVEEMRRAALTAARDEARRLEKAVAGHSPGASGEAVVAAFGGPPGAAASGTPNAGVRDGSVPVAGAGAADGERFARAVELVVAAVLGEFDPGAPGPAARVARPRGDAAGTEALPC